MKVYQLTDKDVQALLDAIDRDPAHGFDGGGGVVLSDVEKRAHGDAHRFYNYQVRKWIDRVCE